MKQWLISTGQSIWQVKFKSYYPFRNQLTLIYLGVQVKLECDKEQYNSAKDGNWTIVQGKSKQVEIIFKETI